jgi:hypothetical protein
MKKYLGLILICGGLLFFPLCFFFGTELGEGVRQGLTLTFRSVLPSLFPTAVVCGILGEMLEQFPLPPTQSLWGLSHLCGFPLGIKNIARAYRRGLVDRRSATRLSCCCANASPSFLLLYVGTALLKSIRAGIVLLIAQLILSFLLALASGALQEKSYPPPPQQPLAKVLTEGISSAAMGCLVLSGYIAFFSGVAALPLAAHLHPFLEVTGGIIGYGASDFYLLTSAVGFSGISVILQNAAELSKAGLSIYPMVAGKILYGIFLPPIAYFLIYCPLQTLAGLLILTLFLISFDKRRKKRYNIQDKKVKGAYYDLFQRYRKNLRPLRTRKIHLRHR